MCATGHLCHWDSVFKEGGRERGRERRERKGEKRKRKEKGKRNIYYTDNSPFEVHFALLQYYIFTICCQDKISTRTVNSFLWQYMHGNHAQKSPNYKYAFLSFDNIRAHLWNERKREDTFVVFGLMKQTIY